MENYHFYPDCLWGKWCASFSFPPSVHPYILSVCFLNACMSFIRVMTCHAVTQVIPPYNGFGSLEDSLQNCLSLIPEPPKKDVIKLLENDHKVLRYAARLVRIHLICIISWVLTEYCAKTTQRRAPSSESGATFKCLVSLRGLTLLCFIQRQ